MNICRKLLMLSPLCTKRIRQSVTREAAVAPQVALQVASRMEKEGHYQMWTTCSATVLYLKVITTMVDS